MRAENENVERTVLLVPGLRGSGPGHWQTLWQARHPSYRRVLQHDWLAPRLDQWAAALDGAIAAAGGGAFLAAHGFGCLAALARLARSDEGVAGLLLVAPRDPAEFGLVPQALRVPAILVASRNDACLGFASAKALAHALEATIADAGDAGHIDGAWPKGERLLGRLFAMAEARRRELAIALAMANG
jgi:predicted alpha/beta hydrolase family esterase